MKREIYVSTDVETDGPIPGPHSMLSLGSAAFVIEANGFKLIDSFSGNFETLPGASGDPDTMAWWATQPEAWAAHRINPQPPEKVMTEYVEWVERLNGKPAFVAYPAGFDFLFVYWYMIKFVGRSPFSFSALDMKTFASAVLGCEYRNATKKNMPKHWFSKHPHTHKAVDDAIEQGELFCRMFLENQGKRKQK